MTLGKGGEDIKQTALPDTGGWQNWWTVSDVVWLQAGTQTRDVYATKGGWNINWWRFELLDPDYSAWETTYGISGSGRLADPDGDARNNGTEYVFGGDPARPSDPAGRAPAVSIDQTTNRPTFTYTRRIDAPQVTYTAEVSEDFHTWSPCVRPDGGNAQYTFTQLSTNTDHGDGSHTVTIRYNVALSEAMPTLYFRLKAEE